MHDPGKVAGIVRAAIWASGSAWFNGAFAAASWIITARYVPALDLGAYAVAASWASLVALPLTALALHLPVLHHGANKGVLRVTAGVTALIGGGVLAVACGLPLTGVPPSALVALYVTMVLQRVLNQLALVLEAELERRLDFHVMAVNRTAASVVSCALQAGLAIAGWGAWAIATRELVGAVVFLAMVARSVREALGASPAAPPASGILRTAIAFVPEQVFDRLAGIVDSLVVEWLAGLATVGALAQLRTLAGYVRMTLVPFLIPVSRSAFAAMRDDPEGRGRVRTSVARFLIHVAMPVAALFVAAPQALESVLWGPKWAIATAALPAMAFQVVLGPLMELRLMEAVGRDNPGIVAVARAGSLAVYLGALLLLVPRLGATGAAFSLALAAVPGIVVGARQGALTLAPRDALPVLAALVAGAAATASGLAAASPGRLAVVLVVYAILLGVFEGSWLKDQVRELRAMAKMPMNP